MEKKSVQNECLICSRIRIIEQNKNPYFVIELKKGYVVLGDYQFFKGYTLFLCKEHAKELHELSPVFRKQHLCEMSQVAEAVYRAFHPRKLNYELLGNTDEHIHWHIFPRHPNDPLPKRTVWNVKKEIRNADSARPSPTQLAQLKRLLKKAILAH
jgi:diadenosine tetraphosphate (Ap4A) HIT family hydrolase